MRRSSTWAATTVIVSAAIYLIDFITNLITLRTYYSYGLEYRDGITGGKYLGPFVFGVIIICVAHLSNVLIFWVTLDPQKHPYRAAYFLPLIHLWRLVKRLLGAHCSCSGFRDDLDEEAGYLYNVLGMSLEGGPLLILQIYVRFLLGWGEVAPNADITLRLSISASLLSVTYNASVSVLFLVRYPISCAGKVGLAVAAGLHAISALVAKAFIVVGLTQGDYASYYPLLPYLTVAVIFPLVFYFFQLIHEVNGQPNSDYRIISRHGLKTAAHCFALSHISLTTGSLYVAVKSFITTEEIKFHRLLVIATLLHILVEIIFISVTLVLSARLDSYYSFILTTKQFLGIVIPALTVLMLSTITFIVVNRKADRGNSEEATVRT